MKTILLSVLFVLSFALPSFAQVATPITHLGWTQVGQAALVANAATYNLYVDGATTPVVLTGVVCVAGTPVTDAACTSNIPALTVGQHTVTLAQNIQGAESSKSSTLSFMFVVVVTPSGLTLKP